MRHRWIALGLAGVLSIGVLTQTYNRRVTAGEQPAPVTKESSAVFRRVVKQTLPAVVSISPKVEDVSVSRREGAIDPNDLKRFFSGEMTPEQMRDLVERFRESEEGEGEGRPNGGFGSGVIVSRDGTVLTNNHVVGNSKTVEVRLQDGRTYASKKILRDPKTDLAIVQLDTKGATDLPTAELGDSSKVEIGDWVLAMGAPFELTGTVTAGIISAKQRPLGVTMYEDFLQTDAAINPGNSGGPIIDLDGRIVGINTAIRSRTGTFSGIGFAIPSNMCKDVLDHLIKYGRVRRGYLGIQMEGLEPPVLRKLGLKNGIRIAGLTGENTPATKAGMQADDIILEVDGQAATDLSKLRDYVAKTEVGKQLQVKVQRGDRPVDLTVTIEEQPESFGLQRGRVLRRAPQNAEDEFTSKELGVRVAKAPKGTGLVVKAVTPNSPAAKANIAAGSILLQAEKRDLDSPEQLAKVVESTNLSEGLLLKVQSPDGSARLVIVQK